MGSSAAVPALACRNFRRLKPHNVFDPSLMSLVIVSAVLSLEWLLSFDPNKDTRLDVGLLKVQGDEICLEEGFDCDARPRVFDAKAPRSGLEIGTPERPIDARHTAKVRLVYFEGMKNESLPALVCCGGRLDIHGSPLSRTWVKLGATAKPGDNTVTLSDFKGKTVVLWFYPKADTPG